MQLSLNLKVLSFAKESNNCAASHKFKIYEKFICDWCKNTAKLENFAKSKKALQYGKFPNLELENLLCDWVVGCQENNFTVNRTGILVRLICYLYYCVFSTFFFSQMIFNKCIFF